MKALPLVLLLTALGIGCASPPPSPVPVAGMEQSAVLEDPRAYTLLFQKIERAVFVREGLGREDP